MKHKTWFRLAIKAIGVLLIGTHMRDVTMLVFALLDSFLNLLPNSTMYRFIPWSSASTVYALSSLVPFLFGVYLFFGGAWIVNKAIPSNKPYCPECGYDISSATSARCPECGIALPESAPPQRQ